MVTSYLDSRACVVVRASVASDGRIYFFSRRCAASRYTKPPVTSHHNVLVTSHPTASHVTPNRQSRHTITCWLAMPCMIPGNKRLYFKHTIWVDAKLRQETGDHESKITPLAPHPRSFITPAEAHHVFSDWQNRKSTCTSFRYLRDVITTAAVNTTRWGGGITWVTLDRLPLLRRQHRREMVSFQGQ